MKWKATNLQCGIVGTNRTWILLSLSETSIKCCCVTFSCSSVNGYSKEFPGCEKKNDVQVVRPSNLSKSPRNLPETNMFGVINPPNQLKHLFRINLFPFLPFPTLVFPLDVQIDDSELVGGQR